MKHEARGKLGRILRLVCLLSAIIGTAVPLMAAEPERPLLKLVGSDVGLCLELRDLKRRIPALRQSTFTKRLREVSVYQDWLSSPDYAKLQKSWRAIEQLAGRPLSELSGELFGEHVVLAGYPQADGSLSVVLLTQTAEEKSLDAAIAAWNRAEPAVTERLEYHRREYFHRTPKTREDRPAKTVFYARFGRLFALSESEESLQRVIDRWPADVGGTKTANLPQQPARVSTLLDSPAYRKAQGKVSPESVACVYFNPRAWDRQLERDGSKAARLAQSQVFQQLWPRCESLVVTARIDRGIVLEAILHYDNSNAPESWLRLVRTIDGDPEFLNKVPRRALLVMAGRSDFSKLGNLLDKRHPGIDDKKWMRFRQVSRGLLLGMDLFNDVLPSLQTNWGFYLTPRQKLQADVLPVEGLLAFELPAKSKENTAEDSSKNIRQALDNSLNTALNLLAAYRNSQDGRAKASVRTEKSESLLLRWIDGFGPYQPAYAITGEYLVFASAPDLVEEFVTTDRKNKLIASPDFQQWSGDFFSNESQILFINVAGIRRFLDENRDFFSKQAVGKKSGTAEAAQERLSRFDEMLQLLDAGFMAVRISGNHIRIVVGAVVQSTQPPRESSK